MSADPVQPLLTRLDGLRASLQTQARAAERLARLPDEVVRLLFELRLFRLWIPRRHGGLELELPQALKVYEAAGSIDGSIGWAVMIGTGGGLFAAYLDEATAAEIYAGSDALIAGSGAPDGQAERVAGGYRVSGRWRYASGAHYASTFTANCIVTSDGAPVLGADGMPLIRAMAFTPAQVAIIPSWDVSGLRGTGSHDFEVVAAFVPEQRTFSVFTDAPREPGPLYRLPFDVLTEMPVAAVGLGIARHALDAFAALARQKKSSHTGTPLAEDAVVQTQYADSHARWCFARSRLHTLAADTWRMISEHPMLASHELAEITAASILCLSEMCLAIGALARLGGMTAITVDDQFARAWRDLQALSAHVSVTPRRLTAAGRILLENRVS